MEWREAQRQGYRLVFRNTQYDDPSVDIALAKTATLALVVGLQADWIARMYASGLESQVAEAVRLRLH